jgi:hypothetical protein
MEKYGQTLAKLEQKAAQLKAQKQVYGLRVKNKERKADTRRKILVGAWAIDKAQKEGRLDELYKMVSAYLTRDIDKRLFSLD